MVDVGRKVLVVHLRENQISVNGIKGPEKKSSVDATNKTY
jgi:hypothetical protein